MKGSAAPVNNRHFTRYVIRCTGYFLDSAFHRYDFRVNNISASGMNVTTDKDVRAAGDALTIHFDPEGLKLPRIKELKGSIVREKKNGAGFNYGIRFLNLSYRKPWSWTNTCDTRRTIRRA